MSGLFNEALEPLQRVTDGGRRRAQQPRPNGGPETVYKAKCVGVCEFKAFKVKLSHRTRAA